MDCKGEFDNDLFFFVRYLVENICFDVDFIVVKISRIVFYVFIIIFFVIGNILVVLVVFKVCFM